MTIDRKSLLHLDGANGSTAFADETGKSWAANGSAQLTTSAPKFGSASLSVGGSTDCIYTADHSDFNFGSSDWTIDHWFNVASYYAYDTLITKKYSDAEGFPFNLLITNSSLFCQLQVGGVQLTVGGSVSIATGGWHHVAVVRYGNDFKLYIDGSAHATTATQSGSMTSNTRYVCIGGNKNTASDGFTGKIDEVSIALGALWITNFTPPTSPYGISWKPKVMIF